MDSLKINGTALDAVGAALTQASGYLRDAIPVSAGDAGCSPLVAKGQEVANAWRLSVGPLAEAVSVDGKQCTAAGQEFGRVDDALSAHWQKGSPNG